MKLHSVLALCVPFAFPLFGASVDVESDISLVTVYNGVARVTRCFAVELPAGEKTTLRFAKLPVSMDGGFVQVAVLEGSALNFGSLSFDPSFTQEDESAAFAELDSKLRALKLRREALVQERRREQDRAAALAKLLDSLNKGIAETGTVGLYDTALKALDASQTAQKESWERVTALEEQLRLLDREAEKLNREHVEQRARDEATCAEYTVEVVSVSGGLTSGSFSYYVSGCHWSPSYVVKADTAKNSLNVEYKASVSQNSGEDWADVALTLETSRPTLGVKPVEPAPVFLRQSDPYKARSSKFVNLLEVAPAPMAAEGRYMADTGNSVVVTASMTGFRATLKDKASVPSSGKSTSLVMMTRDMESVFHNETIPMSAESACLLAKVKNAFPLPMLAGPMQAIVDGSSNGSGMIAETLPGVEIVIGLGVNQNIEVARRTVAEKGKDSGIFGSRRVEERHYVNTITNRMAQAQRIVVRDRVPISKDEKIEVKLLEPSRAAPDSETGLFDQEITLQPGQKVELVTKFRVAYPSDWQISGQY